MLGGPSLSPRPAILFSLALQEHTDKMRNKDYDILSHVINTGHLYCFLANNIKYNYQENVKKIQKEL